jgi:hypothetical protein
METLYGGQAHRMAYTLARLFRDGQKNPDRASHYRRMGAIGVSREIVLWRRRMILKC